MHFSLVHVKSAILSRNDVNNVHRSRLGWRMICTIHLTPFLAPSMTVHRRLVLVLEVEKHVSRKLLLSVTCEVALQHGRSVKAERLELSSSVLAIVRFELCDSL